MAIFDAGTPAETRREAFTVAHEHPNDPVYPTKWETDDSPAYAEKWFGIRSARKLNPDGSPRTNQAAVALLRGGYRTPEHSKYEAFPYGRKQGELFNWEHPTIKGLYRGDNATKIDLGSALGMAVNESKKRFGVEPIEDGQLSESSAELTKNLTGREHEVNYHEDWDEDRSRDYANTMSRIVDRRAKDAPNILPASDATEGFRTIRDRVAENRKAKREATTLPKNIMTQESRVVPFKQEALPLEWN